MMADDLPALADWIGREVIAWANGDRGTVFRGSDGRVEFVRQDEKLFATPDGQDQFMSAGFWAMFHRRCVRGMDLNQMEQVITMVPQLKGWSVEPDVLQGLGDKFEQGASITWIGKVGP